MELCYTVKKDSWCVWSSVPFFLRLNTLHLAPSPWFNHFCCQQTQNQFAIPRPGSDHQSLVKVEAAHGSASKWSHRLFSGCRWTALPHPKPPPCYQEVPACGLCNIQIGWLVCCGRGNGRGQSYCDPTISCFVRSTFWSEDQLEAAINRRKTCSWKNKIKNREKEKKAAGVMIWLLQCTILHGALLLRRKPFIFVPWCFNYLT